MDIADFVVQVTLSKVPSEETSVVGIVGISSTKAPSVVLVEMETSASRQDQWGVTSSVGLGAVFGLLVVEEIISGPRPLWSLTRSKADMFDGFESLCCQSWQRVCRAACVERDKVS